MERKRRLRLIQFTMLILGILIIFFTYLGKNEIQENKIITKETQEKIKEQMQVQNQQGDVFYQIEFSGLDLSGNRYILKSKEALSDKSNPEIVHMKFVEATFYFKDQTVLTVLSDTGIYNNKTLDMNFENNVKANYEGSELFAQKAEYSNLKSYLTISEEVKINDIRGTIVADKLLFDIKKETLNIASFNDGKINANVNLK